TSLSLNLFALTNLDFLNALLLLPSLMFSVSTLVGPFVMSPKPGAWMGSRVWVPKICGWTASLGFYGLVAWFIARGGGQRFFCIFLLGACLCVVLRAGLKYWGYSSRLKRFTAMLVSRMASAGMA